MTGVLITSGSLETDVHRGRTPCEDEGRVSLIKPIYQVKKGGPGQAPPAKSIRGQAMSVEGSSGTPGGPAGPAW